MKKKEDINRIEQFKEWIASNRIVSILVILGITVTSIITFFDTMQKAKGYFIDENKMIQTKSFEVVRLELHIVDSIYNSTNIYEPLINFNTIHYTLDNIKLNYQEYKQSIKNNNRVDKAYEMLLHTKSLIWKFTNSLINVEVEIESKSDKKLYRTQIIKHIDVLLHFCQIADYLCPPDEIKLLNSTNYNLSEK
ncbi:MAG: hypothetical protein H6565_06905 [Lewinellaceae bacterium]|nr:hypothetical protein [Lewinellaceae bacterium]MCB9353758.1 hypothetical protein [Lewinellaceae bacterium]